MQRIRQLLALSGLTALETFRQPLCLLLAIAGVALTALCPLLLFHHFGEDGKFARDSGLALHLVFGMLMAVYAASSALSREIESGTAAAVLSKPVGRGWFYLSKFAGIAVVILAFSLAAAAATLLSERVSEKFAAAGSAAGYVTDWQTGVALLLAPALACALAGYLNYRLRRPFASTAFGLLVVGLLAVFLLAGFFDRAGHPASFDPRVQWRILPASVLVTMGLLVAASFTLALSTRLRTVPILILTGVALLAGLASDYAFGRAAEQSAILGVVYRLVPNWQHFWVADALNGGGSIPIGYVGQALLYAVLYAAGLLAAGAAVFRATDVR